MAQSGTTQAVTPSVTVSDQAIEDDTVTIDEVVSAGPGWIVIHADDDGAPGGVIGFSPVISGTNSDVAVEIDVDMATETLHAMLHVDAGTVGTYEFPGDDVPAVANGEVVDVTFQVTGGLQATPTVTTTATTAPTAGATATVAATTETTATVGAAPTGTPGTLPVTGGSTIPWSLVVLALGGLILLGGMGLALARRS
jgi:hypothetical protein